jgi:peptidoglycan/LPS O-acetylase OafA/YrhL
MTVADAGTIAVPSAARSTSIARDATFDTMRGIAILMVIGIHTLRAPADSVWATTIDAVLRPCVPVFLFTSGYLMARKGEVALARRLRSALAPYVVAFVAAYGYMAWHNPEMDHRPAVTLARFVFGYVFVYYYVFVYVGCTVMLWLVFHVTIESRSQRRQWLVPLLILSIVFALVTCAYIGPALQRFGLSDATIAEIRLRDLPFWFGVTALGTLVGILGTPSIFRDLRTLLIAATAAAFAIYALARVFHVGDTAPYDSVAFFAYAALFCVTLFALSPRIPVLAAMGSGSYFVYLWHIFFVMLLRDYTPLQSYGLLVNWIVGYGVVLTATASLLALVRWTGSERLRFWLGA